MTSGPPVLPLGEAAWTVVLGDTVGVENYERVRALASAIETAAIPGVIETVPGYAAVTVFFDPASADAERVRATLAALASGTPAVAAAAPPQGNLVTIPVRYDGPDLEEVARLTGLTPAEVISRHSEPEYRVYLLGFVPGFAYLGDLDSALRLPRRAAPRPRVPRGSVAIAGAQTGVYPLVTPGGWHLLGNTTVAMFDPAREPAALLRVGDRVRFEPAG